MAVSYLMDSNVLIDYTSRSFPTEIEKLLDPIFDRGFHFSIISKIEVLGFNAPESDLIKLGEFLSLGTMYRLSEEITATCILIRRKYPKVKTPDAIIAASAIVHNHSLLTSNISDFKNIVGLEVLMPASLE